MAIFVVVKEGSSSYLTITFLDKDGLQTAPSIATYQVNDDKTKAVMQAETALEEQ